MIHGVKPAGIEVDGTGADTEPLAVPELWARADEARTVSVKKVVESIRAVRERR